jgi:S1-C subfamily serine protease
VIINNVNMLCFEKVLFTRCNLHNFSKRPRFLCTLIVCSIVILHGCSSDLGPAGIVHSDRSYGGGSGVYIGNGYILTNHHVAENIPGKSDLFSLATKDLLFKSIDIPIEKVLFSNRDIELALVRLARPVENSHGYARICLSKTPVKKGDYLTIISSPHGYFPPETASVVITDDRARMYPDSDSSMSTSKRTFTIVGLVSDYKTTSVAPGSSGGAVLNKKGELVGLVWGRNLLKNGDVEAWITPVSAWPDQLKKIDISDNDRQIIFGMFCN